MKPQRRAYARAQVPAEDSQRFEYDDPAEKCYLLGHATNTLLTHFGCRYPLRSSQVER